MLESFINLLIFILVKPQIRENERLYDHYLIGRIILIKSNLVPFFYDYPKFLEDCVFKNISVEQAKTDYKKALDFIEYVLKNLEDGNFGKAIRLIVAKRSLGWDSDRKKISDLLPDHHVDCFMGN